MLRPYSRSRSGAGARYSVLLGAADFPNRSGQSSRRRLRPENNPRRRSSWRWRNRSASACGRLLRPATRPEPPPAIRQAAAEALRSAASRPVALEIAGRDFNRALDDAAMPADLFFEHAEALGDLRGRLRFAVRLAGGQTADGIGCDDGDFLAQVFGHFIDRFGLKRMKLLQKTEEQQPRTQGIDLPRHASG